MELTLREVTRENWRDALRLAVNAEQQRFIAEYTPIAAIALAKAYVRVGGLDWTPYAFYASEAMVGFAALAYEPGGADNYWLYHFFIDRAMQGQGYGTAALQQIVTLVRAHHPNAQALQVSVHPENVVAQRMYQRVGFQPTGAEQDGELVYALRLRDVAM